MSDTTNNLANVMPSATPTEEEIRAWEALPRDEQLRRLRAAFAQPECSKPAPDSMSDVLAAARSKTDSARG